MKKAMIVATSLFVLAGGPALAADTAKPPEASKSAATKADAKLQKPAGITDEAWNKMSDAEKKAAVEKAGKEKSADKAGAAKTATAPKKEKKGGC